MRMTRVSLVGLLLIPLVLTGQALAQYPPPTGIGTTSVSDVEFYDSSQDISGVATIGDRGGYLFLNSIRGDQPGSEDGFWNAGLFAPIFQFESDTLVFGDIRLMMTDNTRVGYNVGLGARHRISSWDRLIGVNVYYDDDQAKTGFRSSQITVGGEFLGDGWDLRANGYFVLDKDDKNVLAVTRTGTVPVFKDNTFVFENMHLVQQAVSGGDVEVGVPVAAFPWLKAFAGVYYYDAKVADEDGIGVRGRVQARVSDDTSLQLAVTDDDQFGTNFTFGVSMSFSGNRRGRMFPTWSTRERLYEPVNRNFRIATTQYEEGFDTPFINPNTGRPFGPGSIVFIDNSNPVGGTNTNPLPGSTGTFADPFQSVSGAITGAEVIVVRRGTTVNPDGTPNMPLLSDFALLDGQELLGEGLPHTFAGGSIIFPGLATSGPNPYVTTSAGGNIVTLASNNVVNGLNLISPTGGNSIFGNGIKNFSINNINKDVQLPQITGAGGGIVLTNATGTGTITNARFNSSTASSAGGVVIANSGLGTLDLRIDTMPFVQGGMVGLGITAQNSAVVNAMVDGLKASDTGSGMRLIADSGGSIDIDVNDSTFNNTNAMAGAAGDGILISGDNGRFNVAMNNTTATQSAGGALNINLNNNSRFTGKIDGGSFVDAGQDPGAVNGGGILLSMNNSRLGFDGVNRASLTITGASAGDPVRFDNARDDGFHADLFTNSEINVGITNGSFVSAGQDAFDLNLDGASILDLDVDPTPAVGAAANGMIFDVQNGSALVASFVDGNFSSAGVNGLFGRVDGANSVATLLFDNTPFDGSGQTNVGDGVNLAASNSGILTATFSNSISQLGTTGSITNSAGSGIVASATGNAVTSLLFDSIPVNDSGVRSGVGNGIDLTANTAGQLILDFRNASVSDSQDFGIIANVDNAGSTANLIFENAAIDRSGINSLNLIDERNGLEFNVTDAAQLAASFSGGSISGSRDHGIEANVSGGGVATLTMDSTPVEDSVNGDGLNFDVNTGGRFIASINNGSFNNSGDNFIDGRVVDPGSRATIDVSGTTMDTSGGDGFVFDVNNGGVLDFDLSDTMVTNTGGTGFVMNIDGSATVQNLSFNNVDISGLGFNVTNGAILNADFLGGSIANATGSGLAVTVANVNSAANFSFISTAIDNNGQGGMGSGFDADVSDQGTLTASFNNGSIAGNADNGLLIDVQDAGSTADLSMNLTDVSSNVNGDGLHFEVTDGARLTTSGGIIRTMFNSNGGNAIDGLVDGAASFASLGLDGISANNSGDIGVLLNVSNAGSLALNSAGTTTNSTISSSNNHGFVANVDGVGSTATFAFSDTNIDNSGAPMTVAADGFSLAVTNSAVASASFFDSSISSNGRNGITSVANTSGSLLLNMTNTSVLNSGGFGILADYDGASTVVEYNLTNSNVDGSGLSGMGDGLNVDLTNGARLTARLDGSSVSGSQDSGILARVDGPGSELNIGLSNSIVNNSGIISGAGNGVDLAATNGAAIGATVTAGSISNNNDGGFVIDVDGAGTTGSVDFDVDLTLAGSVVDGNRNGDGLRFNATDAAELTIDVTGASISGNGVESSANGIYGTVAGMGTLANVNIDATTASNNRGDIFTPTGAGFRLDVNTGATLNASISNASRAEDNSNSGVRFNARDAGTSASLIMMGSNVVSGNGTNSTPGHITMAPSNRDGIDIDAVNVAQLTVELSGSITGNGGAGADIRLENVTLVNNLTVDALTVTANGGNGVTIDAVNTPIFNGTVTNNSISGNNTRGNPGAGLQVSLMDSPAPDFVVSDNTQIDGVSFVLNASTLENLVIANNTVTGNSTGDGIGFDIVDSNILGAIVNNTINGNTGSGIAFRPSATPAFVTNNGGPLLLDFRSSFTDRLTGMPISGISGGNVITNNTVLQSVLNNNLFTGAGIAADLNDNTRLVADITGNTISDNASFGIGVRGNDGTFDVNVGGITTDPLSGAFTDTNIINNNRGAGVAFRMLDTSGSDTVNSPNTFKILNNVITNTRNDAIGNNSYIGDGIHAQLTTTNLLVNATAVLTNPVIDGNFIGTTAAGVAAANAGRGVNIALQDNTQISDLDITNNVVSNNNGTGIQVLRLDDSIFSDLLNVNTDPMTGPLTRAVTINDNMIVGNGTSLLPIPAPESVPNSGDGIDIVVRNGNITGNDFEVSNNTITNNRANGIHTDTGADARLLVDVRNNMIDSNTFNGIQVTEEVNSPTDLRRTQGSWIKNTITNNGLNGVHLAGATGGDIALAIGLNGIDPADGRNRGNFINSNGSNGVLISGSGSSYIINNEISNNGGGAGNNAAISGHGIDIDALGVTNPTVTIDNNVIVDNRGDGVEIGNGSIVQVNVTARGNTIKLNDGRGVDILQYDRGTLNVSFGDGTIAGRNQIDENGEEGFYVVSTPLGNSIATAQTLQSSPSTTLIPNSAFNSAYDRVADAQFLDSRDVRTGSPDIVLNLDNNFIKSNGKNSELVGTGLVIRVGTSNSDSDTFGEESGGFGNGRVNARIVNNSFEGNFGVDAYIESFTGTVDPPTTGGTWSDMEFTVDAGFRNDPLARLNLIFSGNDGNAVEVTNPGAYYDNAEGTFKSRTFPGRTPPDPFGPFVNASRRRNAQRIPARSEDLNGNGVLDLGEDTNNNGLIDLLNPQGAPGSSFEYPGMGRSTFRIAAGFDTVDGVPNDGINFTNGDGFILDSGPVPDFSFGTGFGAISNANGFTYGGGGQNQVPWGWGSWTPNNGVTSFPDPFQDTAPFQPVP